MAKKKNSRQKIPARQKTRLILHVGPHKTGSSAIQTGLAAEHAQLAELGWELLGFPELRGGAHQVADDLAWGRFEKAAEYLAGLAQAHPVAIITSENFSRLNEEQARFFIQTCGYDEVRVVYYLRNPLDRLQSSWKEKTKHGYRYSFVEFLGGRLLAPFNDREINESLKIAPWAAAAGTASLDLHLYDRISSASAHFLTTYFPEITIKPASNQRVNRSFDPIKTEILRALMGYQKHFLQGHDFGDQVETLSTLIGARLKEPGQNNMKTVSFTLNNPALRRIEKTIVENFGPRIALLDGSDILFENRDRSWEYLSPHIWLAEPDLCAALFDLRKVIHDAHGVPGVDHRLNLL